jgi:signal transduction histidine kinase
MNTPRRSLRTKTTLALLAVALGTSLTFAAVWYATAVRGQRRTVNGLLAASAARAAIGIETFVQGALDAARIQARLLALAEQDLGDADARRAVQAVLTTYRASDPLHITAMAIVGLDGRVQVATDGDRTFGRVVTDAGILAAKDAFTPVALPVRMVPDDPRYGRFVIAVALRDGSGDAWGILAVEYSTLVFEEILLEQSRLVGARAQGLLYDRNLIRLAGTVGTELLFRTNNRLADSLAQRLVAAGRLRLTLDSAQVRRSVREISQLADSTYTYAIDQRLADGSWEKWLGASAPIRPFGGQVSIELPETDAMGATRETLLRDALVLLLVVTLMVAVVAVPVGRRLTEPLESLTETVRRIGGGDEQARAAVGSDAETAQLAAAFNDLADRIATLLAGLRERTRALEDELAQRELLEAQLVQTRKLEAVGKLAGGIAHDFNNLLAVIITNLEFVRDCVPADGEVGPALDDLEDAAQRGAELARQLLAFARMGSSTPRTVDLGAAVQSSERFLRRVLGADVTLELRVPGAPACIHVDPSQLQQVLLNLAVNARDAMPEGGRLVVTVTAEAERCLLAVRDTGLGMAPEVLGRVFEPFFTTKAAGRGTGLGLSTVYGIVSRAGGTIAVASTPGAGTTFTIAFPRVEGEPELAFDATRSRVAVRSAATILVVDDDAGVRHAIARSLRRVGHRVHEAGSGAEGLALGRLYGDALDVLVTDVEMPQGDGRVLAETLRGEFPHLHVVLMSGHAVDGGTAPFIQKPFSAEVLVGRIEALLHEEPSA